MEGQQGASNMWTCNKCNSSDIRDGKIVNIPDSDIFEIFEQSLMDNAQEVQMLNILKNLSTNNILKFSDIRKKHT